MAKQRHQSHERTQSVKVTLSCLLCVSRLILSELVVAPSRPALCHYFFRPILIFFARDFRGMGVFDGMYRQLRTAYAPQFDFTVTEISQRNARSLRAHRRVGFETLHVYEDASDVWEVVVWDWR